MSGHYRPTSEMPFEWHFAGGPMVVPLKYVIKFLWCTMRFEFLIFKVLSKGHFIIDFRILEEIKLPFDKPYFVYYRVRPSVTKF